MEKVERVRIGDYVYVLAEEHERALADERSKVEARAVCLRERATQNRQEATRFEIEAKEVGSREDAGRMTLRATMLRDFAAILEDEAAALKAATDSEGAALASHPNRDDESGRLAAFQALTEGDFFNFTDPEHQSEYVWRYVDAVLDAYHAALKVSTEEEGDGQDKDEIYPEHCWVECVGGYLRVMPPGDWIDFDGRVHYVPAHAPGEPCPYCSTQPQQEEQTSPEEER